MAKTQLNIQLGENYTFPEFIELLSAIEALYDFEALPIVVREISDLARSQLPPDVWTKMTQDSRTRWLSEYPFAPWLPPLSRILREMPRILGPQRVMTISSIHIGSPGEVKVDLGLAEVAKELREWVRWLANGRTADRLDILERKVRILREVGYSEEEIRKVMLKGDAALNKLLGFVKQQKLLPKKTEIIDLL
jgi:hypothetical protein